VTCTLLVGEDLRMFLSPRDRGGEVRIEPDDAATLGHLVQAAGIPLPEVGALSVDGTPVGPGYRPAPGDVVRVPAATRPQHAPPRYLLDVHLGSLARRMRLVGLDTRYGHPVDDADLVEAALAEDRVLLSKDRGLLCRRALRHAAYVRGRTGDEQLADVLDRFAPPLSPYSRCPTCNAALRPAELAEVAGRLEPGTRRTYREFSACTGCGRVYWRGAHAERLEAIVRAATGGP
jgi:uncharacterized protein with PIN domain